MIYQYEPLITEDIAQDTYDYLKTSPWLTEFKYTRKFELEISKFLNVQHCSCVNNGTIAISLALLACGVKPRDYFLVPDLTMVATATAGQLIGARPIFVDIEKDSLCMDLEHAIEQIKETPVKAVVYVSLNGRWGDSNKVVEFFNLCRKLKIAVIEDAAQSFGSCNKLSKIGNQADITTFSFSPQKTITTGQGGCIVTNNEELASKIKLLRDFGRKQGGEDVHYSFGINSKFTDVQAIIGLAQLKKIDSIIEKKKLIYQTYVDNLKIPEAKFIDTNLSMVVPWYVDIYTDLRDSLYNHLMSLEIGTRKIYPTLTSQPCFKRTENNPTVAGYFSQRGLWLPSSLTLDTETIIKICNHIKGFFNDFRQS